MINKFFITADLILLIVALILALKIKSQDKKKRSKINS